jgi:Transposase DDE domain
MAKRMDSRKQPKQEANGDTLRAAVAWILDPKIFADLSVHGNTAWQAVDLVMLAVMWVWSNDSTLTGAFTEAQQWSMQVLERSAVGTFQGFLKALVSWTATLLPLITERLHDLMKEQGEEFWRVGLWVALAVDGSRISVPRSQDNEKALCAPNYGKGKTARYRKKKGTGKRRRRKAKTQPVKPQMWITMLWHMGLRMPWSWKTGPSYSSERDHFRQMLVGQKFPKNTLFCADAGFVGYDLWKEMIDAGHSFLIRVGANVRLLRKLGYVREKEGIVYFWPKNAARKQQPPLVLRLLQLQVGRCTMHLVTNVLDEKKLSVKEAIRLYKLRWGVELQFRTVKQTFGRRKLRSRTAARASVELDWSMLGLWMIQLFVAKEQIAIGKVPENCSVSLAIQVIRTTFQRWSEIPEEAFTTQLQTATKDSYCRKTSKEARYKPEYKDKPAAGKPKVVNATQQQKANLANLQRKAAA